jgi:type IV secretion system protein VirB4
VRERVTFADGSIVLDEGNLGKRYADIRALKSYSEESWATMFDELVMPCDYVITHSFTPVSANKAVEAIARQRNVMNSTADVRRSAAEQLELAHEQAMNRSLALGEHQATVMLIDSDSQRLRECLSELENVAQQSGTTLVADKFMRPAHYYAQLPGNQASYRVRTSLVSNYNMAGFASLHRSDLGKVGCELPWESPLTAFPTLDGSAQLVSFHERGDPKSSPTPGHTVVIGKTGTGKSVLAGFLMAQAVRLDARVFVFDYRNGLEMVTRGLRGSYSYVTAGEATGLNPLQVETDEEGVSWLADWLSRIIAPSGGLQPVQAKRLFEVCETNARAPADLQVWSAFQQQFNLTDDEGDLRSLIEEWGPKGRFGWVFGQSGKDTFSLEGNVVGFDLTQILDADSERERMAVLSYIFRRLERKLRDGRRTIVIIDEAWKAVDNPYFAERIKGWLVTLRKQNAVVVMLTQNPAQLTNSKVGSEIYSSFSNQVLLPNPTADPEDFGPLHLNEKELGFVLGSRFGRAFLWRNEQSSTVLRGDLSALGNLVHIIGGGAAGESVVGEDWRANPEFWKKGLKR